MKLFRQYAGLVALLLFPVLDGQAQTPELAVDFTGGNVQLNWTNNPPGYRLESLAVLDEAADWEPVAMAAVLGADNRNTVTLPPSGIERFFRLGPTPLTTIAESSPANGEIGVGVMRETILRFSAPLATNTLFSSENFFAGYQGRRLLSRIELGSDRRTATLFYLEPLPAGSQVTAVFDATGLQDELGRPLDPDGDGQPGGMATVTFQTFGTTPLADTGVIGHVYASELMPGPGNIGTTNRPLSGVTITVDGQEQTLRTVTDADGFFSLNPCPAGRFFVKIDGRTADISQYPSGAYYPFVGKPWEAIAGKTNNLAGGTGEIFLPKIAKGTLRPISPLTNTIITFPSSVLASNPALAGVMLTVPPNALYANDGTRGGQLGIAPVSPDRLPAPLPPGIHPPFVITIQTDGPNNFDRPVPVRFPNLPDRLTSKVLPPGGRSALWSFNHKTGRWEIQGGMTVSADGQYLECDPGVGVRQPGWDMPFPGSGGSGGGVGDYGGGPFGGPRGPGGGGGPSGNDPCKVQRKSLESSSIQCAAGAGIGILATLAKAAPGVGCAISAAQGVIGAVADCNIDPKSCKSTIGQNILNTAIGCVPILGAGLSTLSTGAGIVKSCLVDTGGAYKDYQDCKKANGLNRRSPGGRPLPAAPVIPDNVFSEQLQLLQDTADLATLVLGSVKWTEVDLPEVPTAVAFLTAVEVATQPGSPGDARLTDEEKAAIMQLPLPSNLTAADAAALLDRMDRMAAGTLTDAEFDTTAILQTAQQLLQTAETLVGRGWVTTYDAFLRGVPGIFSDEDQAQQQAGTPILAKPLAYRLVNLSLGGAEEFGHLNLLGQFDNLLLEANSFYQLDFFDRDTFYVGHTVFQAAENGVATIVPRAAMNPANPTDSDHDGLPDEAETVLGTNPQKADTDGDGISDGAEVMAGTDPLDGDAGLPRVLGKAPATGPAVRVAVHGNYALVAESDSGVGIYNISEAQPTLVARLPLGTVNAVAFAGEAGLVTVGRTGLAILDLSDPLQPIVSRLIGFVPSSDFISIAAAGDLAYVLSEDSVYLVDLVAGGLLDQRFMAGPIQTDTPQDIAVSGSSVYLLTGQLARNPGHNHIHRFNVGRTLGPDTASLSLDGPNYLADAPTRLALAPGYVYVTWIDTQPTVLSSGLTIINETPQGLQLVTPAAHFPVFEAAATGSGTVLAGGASLFALDVHDPLNAVTVQGNFVLPTRPTDIALDHGRAYVSYGTFEGTGGLAAVNFLAPDTLGQPPTISISASFPLAPALLEPGTPAVVSALAVDDVQVRNVEFYINGSLAADVGAYPFDFRFIAPATTNQTNFTLMARAFDTGGNVATTDEINVLVKAGTTAPKVTNTIPLAGAVLPPGLTLVQAQFDRSLDPASVSISSLQLMGSGPDGLLDTADDETVAGSASYDPMSQSLLFTPSGSLPVGEYRATVTPAVTDTNGTHLVSAFSWSFSLRPAVAWNVDSGGLWLTATNWTTMAVPQPGDFVLIDRTNGTYTVSYDGGDLSLDSLFSREPLVLNSGNLSLARRSRIENALTLTTILSLPAGNELDVTGGFNWQTGTLDGGGTTVVDGELGITGNPSRIIQHTLVSRGHATWNEPDNTGILVENPTAVIRNAEGGTWDAFDRQIMVYTGLQGAARFDNDGQFRVFSNDDGITFSKVTFNNRGSVSVATGSLKLAGGGLSTGTFDIAGPGALELGADHLIQSGGAIQGSGTVRFLQGNINVSGRYDVTGTTLVAGGSFGTTVTVSFNGPVLNLGSPFTVTTGGRATFLTPDLHLTNDIIVDGGILDFSQTGGPVTPRSLTLTNAYLFGLGDVEVTGPLIARGSVLSGPGKLTARGSSTLGNLTFYKEVTFGKYVSRPFDNAGSAAVVGNLIAGATFRNLSGATFDLQGDYNLQVGGNSAPVVFVNAGTLQKSAGTGISRLSSPLHNSGLVLVQTGKLAFGDVSQTAGELRLAGGGLANSGQFNLLGGSLTGSGTLEVFPFNNAGAVVSPGLPEAPIGLLHLTGMYTQKAAGTLAMDLAGTTPGTGFDQLNVDLQANLGGTLLINLAPGYQPAVGDAFRILTASQRNGQFATITTTGLATGLNLNASYDATGVTLTVVAGP